MKDKKLREVKMLNKPEKKVEEKFIVINTKFLDMLKNKAPKGEHGDYPPQVLCNLDSALKWLEDSIRSNLGIDLSKKKYYVCNQDEPYAQEVIDLILGNTRAKPNIDDVMRRFDERFQHFGNKHSQLTDASTGEIKKFIKEEMGGESD